MFAAAEMIQARIDALAAISAEPGKLTRLSLTPEQRRASDLVLTWMREAGMTARIDAIGNVIGRYEATEPGARILMLGSHLDTVRDAGRYDGMLGVVTAIACVAELHQAGRRFPFAIEVVGFSDEEGARFGTTLLGSRAIAGTLPEEVLSATDSTGTTFAQAMCQNGFDPYALGRAARNPADILAYVELHIEQGPVLEQRGLAVGTVTAINGSTRLRLNFSGVAGHAGTVPMGARADALACAAECVLAIERRCGAEPDLVGTVGWIAARPGAVNVIPGAASFSIDIRSPSDTQRQHAADDVLDECRAIARRRGIGFAMEPLLAAPAAPCAPWLMQQIDAAIAADGITPHHLPSGAGHDAMAIAAIADIGMIFVRCTGGISHNPAEAVTLPDIAAGTRALSRFIAQFRHGG